MKRELTLIGLKAIADYLGRSPRTIYNWIQDQAQGFPAQKVGGMWEARSVDLDAWRQRQIGK